MELLLIAFLVPVLVGAGAVVALDRPVDEPQVKVLEPPTSTSVTAPAPVEEPTVEEEAVVEPEVEAEPEPEPEPEPEVDRKSTRLNSSHTSKSRMPSSA